MTLIYEIFILIPHRHYFWASHLQRQQKNSINEKRKLCLKDSSNIWTWQLLPIVSLIIYTHSSISFLIFFFHIIVIVVATDFYLVSFRIFFSLNKIISYRKISVHSLIPSKFKIVLVCKSRDQIFDKFK